MTMEIGLRIAVLIFIVILIVVVFWRSTRIPADPNAKNDGPSIGSGPTPPSFDQ